MVAIHGWRVKDGLSVLPNDTAVQIDGRCISFCDREREQQQALYGAGVFDGCRE
jgi:hypothetical protein